MHTIVATASSGISSLALEAPRTSPRLRSVVGHCSKLALRCEKLRRVCYYCINILYSHMLTKLPISDLLPNGKQSLLREHDRQTSDLFHILIDDISQLDSMELQLRDLAFVSAAAEFKKELMPLEKQLKRLALTTFELCQDGGVEEDIHRACVIPSVYIENFRFEPEFIPHVKKLVEEGVNNTEISFIYLLYYEQFADEPRTAAAIYDSIIKADLVGDTANDQPIMFAYMLALLTIRLKHPPFEVRRVIGIIVKSLKRNVETNSASTIE